MSAKAMLTVGLFVLAVGGCSRRTGVAVEAAPDKTAAVTRLDVSTLTSALEDSDADVRFYAVLDLADYGEKAAPGVASLGKAISSI